MNLPLHGIRIIDMTHSWAGPHAARILADFGAEVYKVEYARRLCMYRGGKIENQHYNNQPPWFHMNRSKYSITLDLTIDKDQETFQNLVKISDALIENGRTGVMDKLGFGYSSLKAIKPDIIMLSMAAFGNTGPYARYAGYGATVESVGGVQNLTAYDAQTAPYRIKEIDVINGIAAAGALMTALLHRQRTGEGQYIDFSHMEAATHALIGEHLLEYAMLKNTGVPRGNRHPTYAPQGCYPCQGVDKWITLTVRSEHEWQRFCDAVTRPEWKTDPRFSSRSARMQNHDTLDHLIGEWSRRHTHFEAMEILQRFNIPSGAVLNVSELSSASHLQERGYFVSGVSGSDKRFMGMPFILSEGAGKVRRRGPDLGEHNVEVLCDLLGRSKETVKPIKPEDIGTAYDPE